MKPLLSGPPIKGLCNYYLEGIGERGGGGGGGKGEMGCTGGGGGGGGNGEEVSDST